MGFQPFCTRLAAVRRTSAVVTGGVEVSHGGVMPGGDAAWSEAGALQPLLTRQAGRRIGNREKAFRRDGGATLGAESVLAVRHPRQRDSQTLGPLRHPRRREARQLLKLNSLCDIEEVATRSLRLRHLGLALQSCQDDVEMRFEQTLRRFGLHFSTVVLDAMKPRADAGLQLTASFWQECASQGPRRMTP